MSLRVGDELLFDGAPGRIVAVTDTTGADGRGSITYEGQTFRFRVLKARGPDVPLVATADTYFRVGLLQRKDAPAWFCLVVDDLPAPSGWGRWIQQDRWREAADLEGQDSVVFVLGWRPGEITIRIGGEAQADVFADLVLRYDTHEGAQEAWYQPAYPYNDLQVNEEGVPLRGPHKLGCFKTDANGVLYRHDPDGTLEPIILPRGFAALAQREQDTWPSAPTPERVLTRAEVWWLQEHVEISEGLGATLNVAACSLHITGPADGTAYYRIFWEDGPEYLAGQLVGGDVTLSYLPLGRWTVHVYSSNHLNGSPRQYVDCGQSGETYDADFGSDWAVKTTGGMTAGHVYLYGATPAVGLTVYAAVNNGVSPYQWIIELGTTDGDGYFEYAYEAGEFPQQLMVADAELGGWVHTSLVNRYWDPVLGARVAASAALNIKDFGDPPAPPEVFEPAIGLYPWGCAGFHPNLLPPSGAAYVERTDTGEKHYFQETTEGNGLMTDPLPRAFVTQTYDPMNGYGWTLDSAILYSLCDADGTVIDQGDPAYPTWALDSDATPAGPTGNFGTHGPAVQAVLGGKIEGNVVEASRHDVITPDNLPEAFRMGLEFGAWRQPLEARAVLPLSSVVPPLSGTERGPGGEAALTFQSFECPYCGGPAWLNPDADGYGRGFCMQCADFGIETDSRTYFITATLSADEGWQTRWVRNTTAGAHAQRLIRGWPRPEEYDETDDYLVWDWQDLGIPRWVAVHLVLGTWANDAFTDGESIADAEARLGRIVGPVMLKFELTEDYEGSGQTLRIHCTRLDGRSEARIVTIAAGSRAGDLFPLAWRPHHCYPEGYYTDVTGIEKVAGDGAVSGRVVNDGPAWHSTQGVQVLRATHSPYACDVAFGGRDPFLVEDFGGRLHLVYIRDGQLLHRTLEGTCAAWSHPANITALANWPHPCTEPSLAPLPHAELLAAAHTLGATQLWRTRDDGERWG
ncbi:MAG: hypothetical protein FJX75_08475 [Armatimonadetes bacterium]|nr:hypothetical protein [Armatimonadota bacterium]